MTIDRVFPLHGAGIPKQKEENPPVGDSLPLLMFQLPAGFFPPGFPQKVNERLFAPVLLFGKLSRVFYSAHFREHHINLCCLNLS